MIVLFLTFFRHGTEDPPMAGVQSECVPGKYARCDRCWGAAAHWVVALAKPVVSGWYYLAEKYLVGHRKNKPHSTQVMQMAYRHIIHDCGHSIYNISWGSGWHISLRQSKTLKWLRSQVGEGACQEGVPEGDAKRFYSSRASGNVVRPQSVDLHISLRSRFSIPGLPTHWLPMRSGCSSKIAGNMYRMNDD